MTRDPRDIPAAGGLRDQYGRIQFVVKTPNAALNPSDVQTPSGPFDADGREHIALIGVVTDAAGDDSAVGVTTIGATPSVTLGNHSSVNKVTLPAGSLAGFQAYMDGYGGGTGVQRFRVVVYKDDSGAPGDLVGTSSIVTITANQAASWVVFGGTVTVLFQGIYWWGIAAEVGGVSSNSVARYFTDVGAADAMVFNTDIGLAANPVSPFGTVVGTDAKIISLQASFTPAAGIPGLTIRDEGVQQGAASAATTLDFTGDGVAVTLTDEVATVHVERPNVTTPGAQTLVEAEFPLEAGATYYGPAVDCTVGKLVTYRSRADQAALTPAGVDVQETADGGLTYYPISWPYGTTPVGTVAGFAAATVVTPSVRRVRFRYSNGAVTQGSFEIVRSVA